MRHQKGKEGLQSSHLSSASQEIDRPCRSIHDLPAELLSYIFELGHRKKEDLRMTALYFLDDSAVVTRSRPTRFYHLKSPRRNDDWEPENTDVTQTRPHPSSSCSFRIVVSLVCRYWRHVAIMTPSLWTSIISVPNSPLEAEHISTMISRSGALPLDVFLHFGLNATHHGLASEKRIITHVATSASRLVTPDLISAHLSWNQLVAILHGASALKKLVLCPSEPSGGSCKWDIKPPKVDKGTGTHDSLVHLPNLSELAIGGESDLCITALLRVLHMPALKRLQIHTSVFSSSMVHSLELIEELTRHPLSLAIPSTDEVERQPKLLNNLEHFQISNDVFSNRDNLAISAMLYDELHNLRSLRVYLPHDAMILKLLHPYTSMDSDSESEGRSDAKIVRLPRLETLIIQGRSGGSPTQFGALDGLQIMVRRRQEAGFPIKAMYLRDVYWSQCHFGDEDAEWLIENVETISFF